MTNSEQIQDLKKKAQNKSLPASAVAALNKRIAELEKSEPKKSGSTKLNKSKTKPKFKEGEKVYLKAGDKDETYTIRQSLGWNKEIGINIYGLKDAKGDDVSHVYESEIVSLEKKKSTKAEKPKKEKTKTSYKAAGKDVDEMDCEELEKLFAERKDKAKKSEKKSKTRPVIEKIVSNVATATKQAIDSVSAEDIKKNPKKFIEKCMNAEKSGEAFIGDLKSLLGEEYDKSEVSEGMEKILIHIKKLKEKYVD